MERVKDRIQSSRATVRGKCFYVASCVNFRIFLADIWVDLGGRAARNTMPRANKN